MFKNISLELSLKPFKETSTEYIEKVICQIFDQWSALLKNRKVISIMLWTADGSELLDYAGNLDDEFEWCRFVGGANNIPIGDDEKWDISLHHRSYPYAENSPKMTYGILKCIANTIKAEGKKRYPDSIIRVGETFDIGPEFARSDFKYNRHPEICTGHSADGKRFLNSYGVLNGDTRKYAGYPNGIPDKTPFSTFLGRQTQCFLDDLSFDYLWLSNGVGFSAYPWSPTGSVFDGEDFNTEGFRSSRDSVFGFWTSFREECPDYPVEVRGTNYSAGVDYASDAVPLYDLYNANFNILPPPNSPWAALDGDFGLELMGHMTRICELPSEDFMFRYYIHDPWWANSPWYDRYEGQPHDIYLPMALSRIGKDGSTESAGIFNILSIDNSYGCMPDSCVNEPLPHILKAEKDSPDEPSPFVWVYPLREFTTTQDKADLRKIMSADWFMCQSITNGLPVSTVVSCDNFLNHSMELYKKSVLITPVPQADSPFEKSILAYAENGGKVIFYGSVDNASDDFKSMFKLSQKPGVSGEIAINRDYFPDTNKNDVYPGNINVREFISDGEINTISDSAIVTTDNGYALASEYKNALWYRAPLGGDLAANGHIDADNGDEYIRGEIILRKLLEKYGYTIRFVKPTGNTKTPVIMLHRHDNSLIFSVYSPDTTVETQLKTPLGAPLVLGYETELKNGCSTYHFPRAEHRECRVFVEQENGVVLAKEATPSSFCFKRRIHVKGLNNATVRFFAEKCCLDNLQCARNVWDYSLPSDSPLDFEIKHSDEFGTYAEIKNISGDIIFCMPHPERGQMPKKTK